MKTQTLLVSITLLWCGIHSSGQVSKKSDPAYLQTFTAAERKDYDELKTDWEKKQRTDPGGFKKVRARVILHSQMVLGQFGYGTLFTGALDSRTEEALRSYQAKKGIPVSGDVDPITYYWLTRDADTADKREVGLSSFSIFVHDDYAWADGAWDGLNTSDSYLQSTHLECYKDRGICIETDAIESQLFGFHNLNAKLTEFHITRWDQYEVVAEDNTPGCERDQLILNQQEKSVMLLSTPTYKNETCKETLGNLSLRLITCSADRNC